MKSIDSKLVKRWQEKSHAFLGGKTWSISKSQTDQEIAYILMWQHRFIPYNYRKLSKEEDEGWAKK